MKLSILLLLAVSASAEMLNGLLDGGLSASSEDSKMLQSKDEDQTSSLKKAEPEKFSASPFLGAPSKLKGHAVKIPAVVGAAKIAKVAAPVKALGVKKAVAATVLAAPKVKAAAAIAPIAKALKKKPKVTSLKPKVYVIEKKVPVYHKVPVPKKVMVPKFYPVYKPVPYPKIIPVPFKVPVKKIIPKIVKIPKAVPVPKFVAVKKPVPFPIPYPVPKIVRVPVKKPVPYPKYIPIPIPKKVPKFIPVPVKKVIKVPKPYYVPIKVPHVTASYQRIPMSVNVPDIKKPSFGGGKFSEMKPMGYKPSMNLPEFGNEFKFMGMDSKNSNDGKSLLSNPFSGMGEEDKELLKLLSSSLPGVGGDKNKL